MFSRVFQLAGLRLSSLGVVPREATEPEEDLQEILLGANPVEQTHLTALDRSDPWNNIGGWFPLS